MKHASLILVMAVCLASAVQAEETIETGGRVDAVTVYRGQAYVTRLVEVPGPAGLREVIVGGLPQHVVPDSIYAESTDGVEVRSVRYRVRPVQQDVRAEVRELDQQLRGIQDELEANQRHVALQDENRAYLDLLDDFVAVTANVELTKGVLNAETLERLTSFLFDQRRILTDQRLELLREQRSLNERLELLRRQRGELTGTSARTVREAVIFVNLVPTGGGQLRLRYLVNNATWSPSYTIRADREQGLVVVDYFASIQQRSGEEWPDVKMTLSTATPSLAAKAPALTPLTVALGAPPQGDFKKARRELRSQQQQVGQSRAQWNPANMPQKKGKGEQQVEYEYGSNLLFDQRLNRVAGELQILDLVAQEKTIREPDGRDGVETVSVSYPLASRTTLPSRSDRQLIQIASMPLKAAFYKLAVPVLTEYVYEEAMASNDSGRVLLAGPVSAYIGGQFVGHGEIPMVSVGETFEVGFGIDPSLRASRELVKKRQSIQGGNRVVTFTYRLALENFGAEPLAVRLVDRIPTAKPKQAKIELVTPDPKLSDDPGYQKTARKKGILRWDVQVPQQATGTEAFALEYQFNLEYDKQMSITALP